MEFEGFIILLSILDNLIIDQILNLNKQTIFMVNSVCIFVMFVSEGFNFPYKIKLQFSPYYLKVLKSRMQYCTSLHRLKHCPLNASLYIGWSIAPWMHLQTVLRTVFNGLKYLYWDCEWVANQSPFTWLSDIKIRIPWHWTDVNAEVKFSFHPNCCYSMWTADWIYQEQSWKCLLLVTWW